MSSYQTEHLAVYVATSMFVSRLNPKALSQRLKRAPLDSRMARVVAAPPRLTLARATAPRFHVAHVARGSITVEVEAESNDAMRTAARFHRRLTARIMLETFAFVCYTFCLLNVQHIYRYRNIWMSAV